MRTRLCFGLLFIFLFMAVTATIAFAAPHLEWHTDAVGYDEEGSFIIEGYLENDGTVDIDRVNLLTLNVYFKQNSTDWWFANQGNWKNIPVNLQPGDIHKLRLRIINPKHYNYDDWRISGNVNYHIIKTADL